MAATQGDQLGNFLRLGAVIVPPGEPADEVPERGDAQLAQSLGPLFADALDMAHIGVQVRHEVSPFPSSRGSIIINFSDFEKSL